MLKQNKLNCQTMNILYYPVFLWKKYSWYKFPSGVLELYVWQSKPVLCWICMVMTRESRLLLQRNGLVYYCKEMVCDKYNSIFTDDLKKRLQRFAFTSLFLIVKRYS